MEMISILAPAEYSAEEEWGIEKGARNSGRIYIEREREEVNIILAKCSSQFSKLFTRLVFTNCLVSFSFFSSLS